MFITNIWLIQCLTLSKEAANHSGRELDNDDEFAMDVISRMAG